MNYRMAEQRARLVLASAIGLTLTLLPAIGRAQRAAPRNGSESSRQVSVNWHSATLAVVASDLSRQASVSLCVDDAIRNRRISGNFEGCSLTSVLRSIERATGVCAETKASGKGTSGFRLHLPEAALASEQRAVAARKREEALAFQLRRSAMVDALASARAAGGRLGLVLGSLSQEALDVAAEAACEPETALSATDLSHLQGRLVGAYPVRLASSDIQAALARMLGITGPSTPDGGSARGDNGQDDVRSGYVGLVADGGSARITFVRKASAMMLLAQSEAIRRQGIAGVDRDSDADPETSAAMQMGTLVDLAEMPLSMRRRVVRFKGCNRTLLASVLEAVSQQTGVPYIVDDFVRSRETVFPWVLTDKDEYTVEEALRQIAAAYGHRIEFRNGVLAARTLAPGRDLVAEPPVALIARLAALGRENRRPALADVMDIARLSRAQLDVLVSRRMASLPSKLVPFAVQKAYGPLSFVALLSEHDRTKAFGGGYLRADMSVAERKVFDRLAVRGLPATDTDGTQREPGLYARLAGTPDAPTGLSLLLVPRGLRTCPKSVSVTLN